MRQLKVRSWLPTWLALALGLGMALSTVDGIASARAVIHRPLPPPDTLSPPQEVPDHSLLTYARVISGNVPVYGHPSNLGQGHDPTGWLAAGYVWVSLASSQPILDGDQLWYAVNENEYVQADYLEIYQPSAFQGMSISTPHTYAWMVFDAWTAPAPNELPDKRAILLQRYTIVTIYDEELGAEGRTWYRVGDEQWVEQGMVGLVTPKSRPAGVAPDDKWIEIDLYEQTLAAYEGDRMVYATLVSSGLPWWQTERGLFRVWVKVRQAKMSGREGYPDHYFLEDVPWTMYFNREFALHGAYWHDRFGIQHSRGCVNLSLPDAQWLFEWATPVGYSNWTLPTDENPGTWVWVHD